MKFSWFEKQLHEAYLRGSKCVENAWKNGMYEGRIDMREKMRKVLQAHNMGHLVDEIDKINPEKDEDFEKYPLFKQTGKPKKQIACKRIPDVQNGS